MKLVDYVGMQPITGATDLQIIKMFIEENDLESEAIKLISDLSESKLNKQQRLIDNFSNWAPYSIGLKINNPKENLSDETATELEKLILCCLCEKDLTHSGLYDWAKENVPKIKLPYFFFRPAVDYLAEYGIYFKGENKGEKA